MTPLLPASLVLALLTPAGIAAQPAEERIFSTVKTGQHVTVVGEDGRKVEGHVEAVSDRVVRLSLRKASTDIPIDRIVRIEQEDSLRNGAFIGLALGVVAGLIGGALDNQGRGRRPPFMAVSALGNGLIWMALGTGVDAVIDRRKVLYERGRTAHLRVAPVLGADVRGAALSLTW